MSNLGYHFEFLTLSAIEDLGHKVLDKQLLTMTESNKTELDLKIISTIKEILKDYPIQNFRVANANKDNANSFSSDFISDQLGISCKAYTPVIKAPSMGSIYFRITGKKLYEEILTEYKDIKEFREDFLKTIKLSRQDFFKLIGIQEYNLLNQVQLSEEKVKEIYDFLMGKEKPLILQKNNKYIAVYRLNQLTNPNELIINFDDSQLKFIFNNGVILQKRFKTGLNSKTKGYWYNLFKEEWKIVNTEAIDAIRETYSL
jgi:hypothetical protein